MKRAIREVFRQHSEDFVGLDIVVMPQRVFGRDAFTTVAQELLSLTRGYR